MKDRDFLDVQVTTFDGKTFSNPLKLSEVSLISKLAADNRTICVTRTTTTAEHYKSMFG